jgi:hypothetical protein
MIPGAESVFETELLSVKRSSATPLGSAFADLDKFKSVNDTNDGRQFKSVEELVKRTCRKGRYCGSAPRTSRARMMCQRLPRAVLSSGRSGSTATGSPTACSRSRSCCESP